MTGADSSCEHGVGHQAALKAAAAALGNAGVADDDAEKEFFD